ncbi:L-rhamnose mutarotase [Pedobacter changchengzhani]|uniref:L-rhamnose mutarotase n=1 Tax=Pedobacter changchengzhani TaxID=2529274 RepID=A0A4R5MKI8_9SPHI|nr:L-rhamnose mutarotase [Pedobacter changchengzhani]TDG36237.1 L-rhamnose mutarotase [Pedobacter changchengzhani]
MKNLSGSVLILALCVTGCSNPTKTEKSEEKLNLEDHDAKVEFRRFTYSLNSNNKQIEVLLRKINWIDVNKEAKQFGLNGANCYKKDDDYFFIIDAEHTLNSETALKAFEQIKEVSKLTKNLKAINQPFLTSEAALERIYELDQKAIYTPSDGQLKTAIGAHKRFVWTLLLNEDSTLLKEYKEVHSMGKAWPQITKNMKFIGVKDMEIYLDGYRAMLIMDARPGFDMAVSGPKWQELPQEKEWQDHVSKFQRIAPGSSIQEKWQDMEKL